MFQAPTVAATEAAPQKAAEVEKEIIGESFRAENEAGKSEMLRKEMKIRTRKNPPNLKNSEKRKNVLIL